MTTLSNQHSIRLRAGWDVVQTHPRINPPRGKEAEGLIH
jgi:hypothetical protein